jgi:hypothetical protein
LFWSISGKKARTGVRAFALAVTPNPEHFNFIDLGELNILAQGENNV